MKADLQDKEEMSERVENAISSRENDKYIIKVKEYGTNIEQQDVQQINPKWHAGNSRKEQNL